MSELGTLGRVSGMGLIGGGLSGERKLGSGTRVKGKGIWKPGTHRGDKLRTADGIWGLEALGDWKWDRVVGDGHLKAHEKEKKEKVH